MFLVEAAQRSKMIQDVHTASRQEGWAKGLEILMDPRNVAIKAPLGSELGRQDAEYPTKIWGFLSWDKDPHLLPALPT